MNGRIYDPLLGRFLSADVVVQAPFNLQSFNRYSYVMNNPLSLIDPSGFQSTGTADNPVTDAEIAAALAALYQKTPKQYWVPLTLAVPFMLMKGDTMDRPKPVNPAKPNSQPPQPVQDPTKPKQPTPHEVKIAPETIQANQGDTVNKDQAPPTQTKNDAPKEEPKKDDSKKDSKEAASDAAKGEPVKPGDKGSYGDLKAQKRTNGETEALDMDHRPSLAAQVKAAEIAKGEPLTKEEIDKLRATSPAVATPRADHQQQSRTYGGRNNEEQIAQDAADLEAAKAKDDDAYKRKK